jgi:hypothetical protein
MLVPLLAVVSLAFAQTDAPVALPQVHADDSWSYRRTDFTGERPTITFRETVTFANQRVIQMVDRPDGKEKEIDTVYTAEWNAVSTPNAGIFVPDQELFRFPMRPGDEHDASYDVRFPRQGEREIKHQRHVKVVGWEDVKVPAGTFHALRVESEGTFTRVDVGVTGSAKEVMWYAPRVKRYVKWTFDAWTPRRISQSWAWELVDYHVQ